MPIRQTASDNDYSTLEKRADGRGKKQESVIQWNITEPKYHLSEVILDKRTQRQIVDAVSYFKNRTKIFETWGLADKFKDRDGLGINLYGPPGTGKTMAAHAIAKAVHSKMLCVDYADIESKYVGETSKNLKSLFQKAIETESIIFFDEADALLSKRVTNMTSATDVSVNQTRSVLLTLLNNYQGVVLFATNFIQNFDAAFLRRIRYHIRFYLPDAEIRKQLWEEYIPRKMPTSVDCKLLAEKYSGVSGSDISNAVFSAAVSAAQEGCEIVEQRHFEAAIEGCLAVRRANQLPYNLVTNQIISEDVVPKEIREMEKTK